MGNLQISVAQESFKQGLHKFEHGRYEEAQLLLEEALTNLEEVFGKVPENPETAKIYEALGKLLLAQGNYKAAFNNSVKAYKIYLRLKGPTHPDTMKAEQDCKEASVKFEEPVRPKVKSIRSITLLKKKSSEMSLSPLSVKE
jgi:hypothetical protein